MNELKKMQNLHQRFVNGEELSFDEKEMLQNWYAALDVEETLIVQKPFASQSVQDQLGIATIQVAKISREVESLVAQNSILRQENQALRQSIEARLLEKVA
jgi:hypothetical protein